MSRTRILLALTTITTAMLVFAPDALAHASAGQGWFGETDDKSVTQVMFITIAFFPTLILVFSLLQWRLDKRKHAREDAVRARSTSADWRGGW